MKALPSDVTPYKRTPEFTRASTPAGLLRGHNTKDGVWAQIVVLEGTMTYRILEPEIEEIALDPDHPGVIEPRVLHEVVPHEGVRFYVEFCRR
ncbi:MAG TPA: DUF1971 domain-containing protein [Nevskiaceae bacterium]|nr:DUF1971 domain-containing protein [Nevskiaceae bacterium]